MKSKRIISGIIISAIIITSSTSFMLMEGIFQNNLDDNDGTEHDDYRITPLAIPYNSTDLLDLFQSIDINITLGLIETLLEIFDGDFDTLILKNLSTLMEIIISFDIEVFRVYNYSNFNDAKEYLWKYECFDQYMTGNWSASNGVNNHDFYSYSEYLTNPRLKPEILKIKFLNLTPSVGLNQFTIPSLFSTPYILENSVFANHLESASLYLRRQTEGFNGTALRTNFTASSNTNLTYNLLCENLPSDSTLNADSEIVTNPNMEYIGLLNHYLQMDGISLPEFISNHSNLEIHYNYLENNIIDSGDNAFLIADKIRNYLQENFTLSYCTVPETELDNDPINWFCKSQEGMFSDFAATFVALTRAFGVASRFIDGFNSRSVEEVWDSFEQDYYYAVKYQNLYSWAEIFIPSDINGNGYWAQFDVLK